jgi:hypothetical protein
MADEYEQSKNGRSHKNNFARTAKESWRQSSRRHGGKHAK